MIQTPGEDDAEQAAERLSREPEVLWAQPNFIPHTQSTPNDTDYSRQWHFPLINLPAAWDINPGGNSSVTVAVVDSGVTSGTRSVPATPSGAAKTGWNPTATLIPDKAPAGT